MPSSRSAIAVALTLALVGLVPGSAALPSTPTSTALPAGPDTAAPATATGPSAPSGTQPDEADVAPAVTSPTPPAAPAEGARQQELPTASAPEPTAETEADPAPVPATHVLVRFTPRTSEVQQRSTLDAAGLDGTGVDGGEPVPGTGYVQVPVGDEDPAAVVARLADDPAVAAVQEDHVRHGFGWTNDPYSGLARPYLELTRLPRAWDVSIGQGVVVAVLDTGVAAGHEDLAGRVLPGVDLVDGDSDPSDPRGHGTLVAGVVAASGNNGRGAVGAAWGASVLPVRVLDANGNGPDSRVAAGISWAVAHGADVVNLSLGGTATSQVLLDAVRGAVAAGVVVVAAAGNAGTQVPQYPAAYAPGVEGLLSVSATDDDGALAGWSSWGDSVSVSAPGVLLVGPQAGGTYVLGSGTSFAAPLVSGVAALLLSRASTMPPAEVERRIVTTARDAGPRGLDAYYGAGIVDAAAATTTGWGVEAAVATPLSRPLGDAGPSDDSPADARTVSGPTSATLSPEGDADWYAWNAPTAGTYRATVEPLTAGADDDGPELDLVVEVRDAQGRVLGVADATRTDAAERVDVSVAAAGRVLVGVRNANGSAPASQRYQVSFTAGGTQPLFTSSFRAPADPTRVSVGALAAADFTGDGLKDVMTVEDGGGVYVYKGAGNGTLATPVDVPLGAVRTVGEGLAAGDVDGDGDADAVATTATGVLLLKQAGGTMTPAGEVVVSYGGAELDGRGVALVDWDKDGDLDVVASTNRPSLQVLANNGTGMFTAVAETLGQQRFAVGDVTGDGRPDVVTTHAVHPQAAGGGFATAVNLPFGGGPLVTSVAVGDVTGDGRADVVRMNGNTVRVDGILASGALAPSALYPAGGESDGTVAIGDLDVDGRQDVLVVNAFELGVSLLRQQTNGTLSTPQRTPISVTVYDHPGQLAITDLDGDAWPDAVVSQSGVLALRQARVGAPTPQAGWLRDTTPDPHTAGVAVRPTVRVTFERDLRTSDVAAPRVRLVDGVTGSTVATSVRWEAATRAVVVTPTADLVPGHHYTAIVDAVRDAAGATLPEPVRVPFTVAAGGDRYTPVSPTRVLDTRTGVGGSRPAPDKPMRLDLSGVVPVGATAVVLNLTVTESTGPGNVRAYPASSGQVPNVSNVNFAPGFDKPNLVTVAVGADRAVALRTEASTAHLIADLAGYYSPVGAAAYAPLSPRRLLDTRTGLGARPGPVAGGEFVDVEVTGNGVPANALAVVLNLTGTEATASTHVRAYPAPGAGEDQTPPGVSNLNLSANRDEPNLVTVPVGDDGRVRFWVPVAATHLIADINGYYAADAANGFVPVAPVRVADTRFGQGLPGTLQPGGVYGLTVAGSGGVPAGATAAVLNVTGAGPSGTTHVRVFPTTAGNPLPDVSTINLTYGRDEANLAVVRLGDGGGVSFYSHSAPTDLVVDVAGYFRY